MDKGAHFYRCDFQVHTPRDTRWTGGNAVSNTERADYAKEFIQACRVKQLEAVAITDHHDLTFFRYIKEAAENELDLDNIPIPPEKKIVVFPGMELTLGLPCQAIIIFDAQFPVELITQIYPHLGINQPTPAESKHVPTVRLDHIDKLSYIYERLDLAEFCKNRYIVLPNVSEGGGDTLLRSGFHPKYKEMPCVGGYLDGNTDQLGAGNQRIIAGKDTNYGPRRLGIFQTSDNRRRDFVDLGTSSTWVKWSVPTAEALRQACLAMESRISQSVPPLPSTFLTSIDVSNSKFMGQIYLEINQQFNAVIGGRGTGKSTILEYVRWGLCDQVPQASNNDADIPNYQERRRNLVTKTLFPFNATVQISFLKNGVPHVVRRKSENNELSLKIGSGSFELCSEDDVRNLLPIQAYSQKQLSSVGVSVDELKRLIYSPIRQEISDLDSSFSQLASRVKTCYDLRRQKRAIQAEIEKLELELKSVDEQAIALGKKLTGISEDDQKTITAHKQYEIARQLVENWRTEIVTTRKVIFETKATLAEYPSPMPSDVQLPQEELTALGAISRGIQALFLQLNTSLDGILTNLKTDGEQLGALATPSKAWQARLDTHNKNYETAKLKSTAQATTLNQIQQIELRTQEIRKTLSDRKQIFTQSGDPEANFEALRLEWFEAHKQKADILDAQCQNLSALSEENLRASLGRGKGTTDLETVFKRIASGSNLRGEKVDGLCEKIRSSAFPIQEWHKYLGELELLAYFNPASGLGAVLPNTPVLTSSGFATNDIRKLAEKLNAENWIDLFLVQLEDIPEFEYRTREGEYINFIDASAGQQATALMKILLNQDGPPLIVDQPEDDLDNQMVTEIASLIWKSKMKRQLIFSSHNANIVVNGDAELVICCDYLTTADQSKGNIRALGAIDVNEIRQRITAVMEGGEVAFRLRKEKYGF